ncbi:MAG TPA: hypothetical protein PKD63_10905 [Solirubrobacteraceae bacterium]|nr:hypothetical protein [Solirubrobacteraceae bacterium]
MLLRSRPVAAPIVLAAVLATLAPAASALVAARPPIVVQASIRGVALGMTPTEVRSALGAPTASAVTPNPIIGKVRIWRYPGLRIMFDSVKAGRTVLSVTSTSRADRTAAGVGVGARETAVQRGVPGVRCATRYGYRSCTVGGVKPGRVVTDFSISGAGKVTRVTLSRVVD